MAGRLRVAEAEVGPELGVSSSASASRSAIAPALDVGRTQQMADRELPPGEEPLEGELGDPHERIIVDPDWSEPATRPRPRPRSGAVTRGAWPVGRTSGAVRHARVVERRHLAEDPRRRDDERQRQSRSAPLAEAEPEIEQRIAAPARRGRSRWPGSTERWLAMSRGGRNRREPGGDERRGAGDEPVEDDRAPARAAAARIAPTRAAISSPPTAPSTSSGPRRVRSVPGDRRVDDLGLVADARIVEAGAASGHRRAPAGEGAPRRSRSMRSCCRSPSRRRRARRSRSSARLRRRPGDRRRSPPRPRPVSSRPRPRSRASRPPRARRPRGVRRAGSVDASKRGAGDPHVDDDEVGAGRAARTLIAAPPAAKLRPSAASPRTGTAKRPDASTPWSPAKMAIAGRSTVVTAAPRMPASSIASDSSRPRLPGGLVSRSSRRAAAAMASASSGAIEAISSSRSRPGSVVTARRG